MQPKWIIGLGFIFVISAGVCIVLDQAAGQVTVISEAMNTFSTMDFSNPITGVWSILRGAGAVFAAFFKILLWDYNFFSGYWVWFRFLMATISLGIIVSLAITLIRGVSSA